MSGDRVPEVSFVMPVFNEPDNIEPTLQSLRDNVKTAHDILVVYDFDEDTTLPVVRALQPTMPEVRLIKNELGRGVLNAMKTGNRKPLLSDGTSEARNSTSSAICRGGPCPW